MSTAQRDNYGVPALLGNGEKAPVPIYSTPTGSLHVSDSKKLLSVIKINLSVARNKELVFEGTFNEITVNIIEGKLQINFTDPEDVSKELSIVRPTSISTTADHLWITNSVAAGNIELWLWG